MLFYLIFAFFIWLILREIRSPRPKDNTSLGYMAVCLLLALLSLWKPISNWNLERKMTAVVHELSGFKPTDVHCQTLGESLFDRTRSQWVGYTFIETGDVVFKGYWCDYLKDHLADPAGAAERERYSLMLLVHEAMHVRGERNEQKTECQAIQRHYRAALLLGVPEELARQHSVMNYQRQFPRHPYYSPNCKPQSEMDEKLADSTWNFL